MRKIIENYFLKFKQRFILLSLGYLTWFVLIYSSFKYYEQNRLEDIEKVEISNGKRNLDMNKNNIIE